MFSAVPAAHSTCHPCRRWKCSSKVCRRHWRILQGTLAPNCLKSCQSSGLKSLQYLNNWKHFQSHLVRHARTSIQHAATPTPAVGTPAYVHTCTRRDGGQGMQADIYVLLLSWTRSVQIPLLHSAYCSRLSPPESFPGGVQGDVQHCLSKLQVLRTLCSCVHPDLGEQVGTPVSGAVLTCTCVFQISLAVLHRYVYASYVGLCGCLPHMSGGTGA